MLEIGRQVGHDVGEVLFDRLGELVRRPIVVLAGEAGVVSSAFGSISGADENGRGACGGGAFAVDADAGPDVDLMRRAKAALLRAFEEVFETELTRRGGAPPVS